MNPHRATSRVGWPVAKRSVPRTSKLLVRGTNALLFPRLGDYAVFGAGSKGDELKGSGYFDEDWESK
jgi:hypothetical protein